MGELCAVVGRRRPLVRAARRCPRDALRQCVPPRGGGDSRGHSLCWRGRAGGGFGSPGGFQASIFLLAFGRLALGAFAGREGRLVPPAGFRYQSVKAWPLFRSFISCRGCLSCPISSAGESLVPRYLAPDLKSGAPIPARGCVASLTGSPASRCCSAPRAFLRAARRRGRHPFRSLGPISPHGSLARSREYWAPCWCALCSCALGLMTHCPSACPSM